MNRFIIKTMTTIKSFTSLEQSKKLAEILPIESADMYYPNRIDIKYQGALPIEYKHGNPLLSQEIAAWGLAALLGVLPNPNLFEADGLWHIFCDNNLSCINGFDNPVDACVAMVEKLNELKML